MPPGEVKEFCVARSARRAAPLKPVVTQVGVMSRVQFKIVLTTVSITKHGHYWQRELDDEFLLLGHKRIGKRTKAYKDLIARFFGRPKSKRYTSNKISRVWSGGYAAPEFEQIRLLRQTADC